MYIMTSQKTLGQLILDEMKRQELTATQLATLVNRQRTTIYSYLKPECDTMSIDMLLAFSEALKHNFVLDYAKRFSLGASEADIDGMLPSAVTASLDTTEAQGDAATPAAAAEAPVVEDVLHTVPSDYGSPWPIVQRSALRDIICEYADAPHQKPLWIHAGHTVCGQIILLELLRDSDVSSMVIRDDSLDVGRVRMLPHRCVAVSRYRQSQVGRRDGVNPIDILQLQKLTGKNVILFDTTYDLDLKNMRKVWGGQFHLVELQGRGGGRVEDLTIELSDRYYPHGLYSLGDEMPRRLYTHGNVSLLGTMQHKVAIMGGETKSTFSEALQCAYQLGSYYGKRHNTLVVDSQSAILEQLLRGCFDAGGQAIVICRSGLPKRYYGLMDEVIARGGLAVSLSDTEDATQTSDLLLQAALADEVVVCNALPDGSVETACRKTHEWGDRSLYAVLYEPFGRERRERSMMGNTALIDEGITKPLIVVC